MECLEDLGGDGHLQMEILPRLMEELYKLLPYRCLKIQGIKAFEYYAPAILNMSADYNGSSEKGAGQPMAVGGKQFPRGLRGHFVKTTGNQDGTNEGRGNISEAAYGSKVAIHNPTEDFCWPVVAISGEEENIGKIAYDSILNLESPDPTTLLRIMMGDKYSSDKVSEQFQNVARLQAPDFATLLTVMNNAGYGEATDDGHYDVDKVMAKLEGW